MKNEIRYSLELMKQPEVAWIMVALLALVFVASLGA